MMKHNEWMTPEGTRDLLFEECTARRRVERTMAGIFEGFGYQEVATPAVEFYDVFTREGESIPPERMFKLTDLQGRLLVLRPDLTAPIARLAGTRLREAARPLRLYYNQNVYRMSPGLQGRRCEIGQMGLELIGAGSRAADGEVLAAACYALDAALCGEGKPAVEIGHVGIFRRLCELLQLSEAQAEATHRAVREKNPGELAAALEGCRGPAVQLLRRLPTLYGGVEVLDEIRRTLEDPQLLEAVQLLEADFETLRALPLTVDVQVDLGLVGSLDYYTGILLKGYLPGSGAEVLSGGRYDRLLAAFGSDLPAIGFALDLDGLICPREDDRRGVPEVLVYADPARPMAAILCGQRLSERGMRWTHSLEDSWEAAVEEARRRGIPRVIEADGSRTAETGGQSR